MGSPVTDTSSLHGRIYEVTEKLLKSLLFFFHLATNFMTMFSVYTLEICAGDAPMLKILYKHSRRMLRPWR